MIQGKYVHFFQDRFHYNTFKNKTYCSQEVCMNNRLEENHIFPFLWMRGEEEKILRTEIQKVHECGIGAICVEARPHDVPGLPTDGRSQQYRLSYRCNLTPCKCLLPLLSDNQLRYGLLRCCRNHSRKAASS